MGFSFNLGPGTLSSNALLELKVFFRLWNADDALLWKDHGWVSYDAIKQATAMYTGNQFDPKEAYDLQLAQALLKEDRDQI